jgi:LysM repeat protein
MKSSSPQRRSRPLRAKASTLNPAEFEDYGPEPNMKLSHAFMVVLALHIIAVGGLFAFNKLKTSHVPFSLKSKTEHLFEKDSFSSQEGSKKSLHTSLENNSSITKTVASHQQAEAPAPLHAAAPTVQSSVSQLPSGVTQNPPPAPSSPLPLVATSSQDETSKAPAQEALKDYTIVKGDNPYKLAKKFHVSYEELMKMNNITDPRKIQIGQKLKIPAKAAVKGK